MKCLCQAVSVTCITNERADGFNSGVLFREGAGVQTSLWNGVAEFCPIGGVRLTVNVEQQSSASNRRLRGIDEGGEVIVGVYSFLQNNPNMVTSITQAPWGGSTFCPPNPPGRVMLCRCLSTGRPYPGLG